MELWMFIALFTRTLYLSLSWVRWIQSMPSQLISLQFYPPIYATVLQVVSLYVPRHHQNCICTTPVHPICTMCFTHLILLDLSTQVTFGEVEVKKQGTPHCAVSLFSPCSVNAVKFTSHFNLPEWLFTWQIFRKFAELAWVWSFGSGCHQFCA